MNLYRMDVKIENLSPLVLSANRSTLLTTSMDFISGGALRGILIETYLEKQEKGRDDAHRDPLFNRLFFGCLSFAPAFPILAGRTSYPLPLSLQISKDGTRLNDMLKHPDPDKDAGFKVKRGLGTIDKDILQAVGVEKNICLHINRTGPDGGNRLAGSSQDSRVFSYESINAGQRFRGAIYGDREDLAELSSQFSDREWICYVGKSKFTQYGRARIQLKEPSPITWPDAPQGEKIYLRLLTPLVTGEIICDARKTLKECFVSLGKEVEICEIFGAQDEVTGFNNRWKMHRPDITSLAAGTVFGIVRQGGWDQETWQKLGVMCYRGVGWHSEEGYGLLRLWDIDQDLNPCGKTHPSTKESVEETPCREKEVERVARLILTKRLEESVRLRAYNDVQTVKKSLGRKAHPWARLTLLLGARKDLSEVRRRFTEQMNMELDVDNSKKPLAKYLQEIRLRGMDLRRLLLNPTLLSSEAKGEIPEEWMDFATDTNILKKEDGTAVLDDESLRGGIFYDYWYWFFHHARKETGIEGV